MTAGDDYQLLDSGHGEKLERFGPYTLLRPCSQAIWAPTASQSLWAKADARFSREEGHRWEIVGRPLPSAWKVVLAGVTLELSSTDFGHLGLFPEHASIWRWIQRAIRDEKRHFSFLNLFAYSGGATLAAAQVGARVCHVDASRGMVAWARKNAQWNGLEEAPIRWIIDDVTKFLAREARRGVHYDGILLDPPTFGRGSKGEVFKIERDLPEILALCRQVLSPNPAFVALTAHTAGIPSLALRHLLAQSLAGCTGEYAWGDLVLEGAGTLPIPHGSYAIYRNQPVQWSSYA